MSFMLALRILLDAEDALVDVRARCLPFGVPLRPSGCGNGTGVETFAGEVECEFGAAMFYEIKPTTGDAAFVISGESKRLLLARQVVSQVGQRRVVQVAGPLATCLLGIIQGGYGHGW